MMNAKNATHTQTFTIMPPNKIQFSLSLAMKSRRCAMRQCISALPAFGSTHWPCDRPAHPGRPRTDIPRAARRSATHPHECACGTARTGAFQTWDDARGATWPSPRKSMWGQPTSPFVRMSTYFFTLCEDTIDWANSLERPCSRHRPPGHGDRLRKCH